MEIALKSLWPAFDRSLKSMRATCSNLACHNTQLMRTIPGGRPGIQAGDRWYCSVDCFAMGSRPLLAALSNVRLGDTLRRPRMSLGLTLVAKGYLSPDALRFAQHQSELHRENLDAALLRLNLTTEKQLAAARAAQWGYPVVATDRVGQVVESDIPSTLLEEFSAVPIDYSQKAKRIVLGFVFRVEHSLLEAIEKITGCKAVPCFISSTEYAEQMNHVVPAPGCETTLVQTPGSPENMSRNLGRFAVEVGAREAVFTQCKNFVWARLTGKRGKIDVLFQFEVSSRPEFLSVSPLYQQETALAG